MLSPQATLNLPISWQILCRHWDNKCNLFLLVEHAKMRCGIDFLKFEEEDCMLRMRKHSLYQARKLIANDMEKKDGLTLQKSSEKHKQERRKWPLKRKPGLCKEDFIKFRHGNSSKNKFNKYCDQNGLENHKVKIDEGDASKKLNLV